MPWTPFTSRDIALQQKLEMCVNRDSNGSTTEELYNNSELGLLSDSDLEKWIIDCVEKGAEQSALGLPSLRDGDAYETQDLAWLRDNAASAEDKAWAEREYRRTLFKLWRMHVASTGETWYPPLLNDLHDHFIAVRSKKRTSI